MVLPLTTAALSLIISATARVTDVRKVLTPQLQTDQGETLLLLIDLGQGANTLGATALAQTYQLIGQQAADVKDPKLLKHFFAAIQKLNQDSLLLAYHDRSDGGLFATVAEMAFAGHVGVDLNLSALGDDAICALFTEELGAVIQIQKSNLDKVQGIISTFELSDCCHLIGELNAKDTLTITHDDHVVFEESRISLQRLWAETSYRLQALRDNPECAEQEYDALLENNNPGLTAQLTFDVNDNISAPYINVNKKPKIAILREQGVNGHVEMAAAFHYAGFEAVDVHMSDLIAGHRDLSEFKGLAACGGFSYGDVLGAGSGWAQSILMHHTVSDEFARFFDRADTFSLGVCNGCQMFSQLKSIIPGAQHWPSFERNQSEQFEARVCMVTVPSSPSIVFADMQDSIFPVVVAHGEGRAVFADEADLQTVAQQQQIALAYTDNHLNITEQYPNNPNGSVNGITGLTSEDGRVTILMPHPERVFRSVQNSWQAKDWGEYGPWMRLFKNARVWVG